MDAPERIWAWTTGIQPASQSAGLWQEDVPSGQPTGVEYIRADLVEARIEAALREAANMLIDLGHVSESGETLAAEVLALIPAPGALDRALEKAREEGRREGRIEAGAVFATSDAEANWIADMENACPACGGSGHKGDVE